MKRRTFLTAFAALPLAGCGFQLRGKNVIPWRNLYIDSPEKFKISALLADELRGLGVNITDSAKGAEATLKLSLEKISRTVLALSGGGRVREYRLTYLLVYSMTGNDGREIFAESTIQQSQDFTYDDNLYLAKTAEEEFLHRDLRNNAVQQVVRRLSKTR